MERQLQLRAVSIIFDMLDQITKLFNIVGAMQDEEVMFEAIKYSISKLNVMTRLCECLLDSDNNLSM